MQRHCYCFCVCAMRTHLFPPFFPFLFYCDPGYCVRLTKHSQIQTHRIESEREKEADRKHFCYYAEVIDSKQSDAAQPNESEYTVYYLYREEQLLFALTCSTQLSTLEALGWFCLPPHPLSHCLLFTLLILNNSAALAFVIETTVRCRNCSLMQSHSTDVYIYVSTFI